MLIIIASNIKNSLYRAFYPDILLRV